MKCVNRAIESKVQALKNESYQSYYANIREIKIHVSAKTANVRFKLRTSQNRK